jgi:hypothetical protein
VKTSGVVQVLLVLLLCDAKFATVDVDCHTKTIPRVTCGLAFSFKKNAQTVQKSYSIPNIFFGEKGATQFVKLFLKRII